jgi:IgA Peptidase M64.
MSAADGSVIGAQKIVDHGADAQRYNVVILGDGYRAAEMAKYHSDVQAFVDVFGQTAPYGDLWCGINVHRIDVVSTDSGADDPLTCGDGSGGSGAVARTYFDATFCSGNQIRRLLTCDSVSARNVAQAHVPAAHVVMVS